MSAASIAAEVEGVEGQPVSAQTMRRTLHQIGLHGCRPRRKPLLKMMHKKTRKQFAEDKQTKDMDYWNYVLWSDETKIHLFGSDGVKRVWQQPDWEVYSEAWWWECHGLGLHEWKRNPVAICEALVNSMPKRVKAMLENNGGHTKYWHFGPNLDIFT